MPPRKRKASPEAAKGKTEVEKNEQEEKADVSVGDELKNDENGSLEVGSALLILKLGWSWSSKMINAKQFFQYVFFEILALKVPLQLRN